MKAEEFFVTIDVYRQMEKLGFEDITLPSIQLPCKYQFFTWMREKFNLNGTVWNYRFLHVKGGKWRWDLQNSQNGYAWSESHFSSYEEAESSLIQKMLNIISE